MSFPSPPPSPTTDTLSDVDSLLRLLRTGPDGRMVAEHGGLRYGSQFQPVYSLSHGSVVGHEALLRAQTLDGRPVPPPLVFAGCASFAELLERERISRLVHLANFRAGPTGQQWLFLNVHPEVFVGWLHHQADTVVAQMQRHFELPGHRVVIEVLEQAVRDDSNFDTAVQRARAFGCLLALDDFGAGHSNFDRVWRIRPDIVKLDRSLVARAAREREARRVIVQMVSLLHECGTLVLMEGVETEHEAMVALEADVDLVQGYFFGRPQAELLPHGHTPAIWQPLWQQFESRWQTDRQTFRDSTAPYLEAIERAAAALAQGRSLQEACAGFLALPRAELCYLLGADGSQIGPNLWGDPAAPRQAPAFEPLRELEGARWVRRPYFRRAVDAPGKLQLTRPYRTLHGGHLCVTVSLAFPTERADGQRELQVLCGDIEYR
ncbi:EAL domain-containing protein [Caldimonas brevitalea]|uniref:Diguanylate phosphodiesterase n=1 Tax=Caldimonas brevitalea TaxID=413882 RepID=A0A0G3BS60_9BURK|nr:EAL domain-containing protein [Caldimonas brevitalea]AKJ30251.1 diguanylate phosphodiesterase [Caldimonas brevitalea]